MAKTNSSVLISLPTAIKVPLVLQIKNTTLSPNMNYTHGKQ